MKTDREKRRRVFRYAAFGIAFWGIVYFLGVAIGYAKNYLSNTGLIN
jgi:hypothetical protein